MAKLPWWRIVALAVIAAAVSTATVVGYVHRKGPFPEVLLDAGADGPSAPVVRHDFPRLVLPRGLGNDGQQFYVIARAPMHPSAAQHFLNDPPYRLQRQLYPWLAWLLHPNKGGRGLVTAMFAVGILGLTVGGVATGALSTTIGGPPWMAAVFALLPGAWISLRLSVADGLALALAAAALALSLRGRRGLAVLAAVGAVLARESMLIVIAGFALWRRDRSGLALFAIPAGIAACLALWLRAFYDTNYYATRVHAFGPPLMGIAHSIHIWVNSQPYAGLVVAATVALGILAVTRAGLRSPLGWSVVANLIFLCFLNKVVLGTNFEAFRATAPLLLLSLLALLSGLGGGPIAVPPVPAASAGSKVAE